MSFESRLKDSPSSGLLRVKVYNADAGASGHGMAERNGVGLFARMLTERFPVLPVEEGRLKHPLNH